MLELELPPVPAPSDYSGFRGTGTGAESVPVPVSRFAYRGDCRFSRELGVTNILLGYSKRCHYDMLSK